MFGNFFQIFKVREIRNKIFFVLGVLVVFRMASIIPVPGIEIDKLKSFFAGNQILGLLNIFTGGALSNLSVAMLGMGPYITAVIILQLLTMIFPQLEALYKEEGEAGRQKFNQWGRLLTVPLAALQAFSMLTLFSRQGVIGVMTPFQTMTTIIIVTAGTIFMMWLGELISEKGIGNGVSILIFAGIIAQVPTSIYEMAASWDASKWPAVIAFVFIALLVVAGVVFITEGKRNIPVAYAKQVRGHRVYGGASTYLPMNVNPAGVIPIIFALSILLFPSMVANFFVNSSISWLASAARFVSLATQNPWFYGATYFVLVILFTYFYTAVTFDPKNIADNLQKMGGFVPGIRPGTPTAQFIRKILNRVLLVGALFLGIIAVLPSIVQGLTGVGSFQFLIGGTSVLIVVAVVLETIRRIDSQLTMRDYEGL